MKLLPIVSLFLPLCLAAQSDPPAAPQSDPPAAAQVAPADALRAQAQKFYDALVKGKPRLAQALVCDSGQDEFYNHPKPQFLSAVVASVDISSSGKTAKVTATVQLDMMMRLPNGPGKMPLVSDWLLENEGWCYVPEASGTDTIVTAYGKLNLKPAAGQPGAGASVAANPVAAQPDALAASANAARASMVRFSKQSLELAAGADGKDSLVITNGSQMDVALDYACPKVSGLHCELDHPNLGKGATATLAVKYSGSRAHLKGESVKVTIKPFGREVVLPLAVR